MKVLYIGNYKDGTGWANACINNILALDASDVEVVPRAITFNNASGTCPQRILELEEMAREAYYGQWIGNALHRGL